MKITLMKSLIGRKKSHIATAKALGLSKIGKSVEKESNVNIDGMIKEIGYLLKIEE